MPKVNRKRNLFDLDGKIRLGKLNPDEIKLDPQSVKNIEEINKSLEDAEFITQELLQMQFTI